MEETPVAAPWQAPSLKDIKAGKSPLGLFALLPRDVRHLLMTWMHPVALSRLARCSRALRELCDDEKMWERLFSARGAMEWQRSQATFEQSYIQRFGPLERPVVPRKWRVLDLVVPVDRLKELLSAFTQETHLLVVGFDYAGKTTLFRERTSCAQFRLLMCFSDTLNLGEVSMTIPKIGFNVESVQYKSVTFNCWDIGTQNGDLRPLWRHHYQSTQGVIFLVDSNDRDLIDDAATELEKMMREDELKDACLLVLANKQDLPNAMSIRDVAEGLRLRELRRRAWHIEASCATSGEGLLEGLDWLVHAIEFGRNLLRQSRWWKRILM
jgi:ADP-ribosylation factor protein 1